MDIEPVCWTRLQYDSLYNVVIYMCMCVLDDINCIYVKFAESIFIFQILNGFVESTWIYVEFKAAVSYFTCFLWWYFVVLRNALVTRITIMEIRKRLFMMTSWNGNIFRVTGHLCGEFTGPRWIPHTKASDTELWCFLWSVSE